MRRFATLVACRGMTRLWIRGALWLAAALALPAWAEDAVLFDPGTGYRIAQYRSPVPEQVEGGTRISLDELDLLVAKDHAVLVDVMAAEGAGPDPVSGEWRLSKPRHNIPGSVWLPDVGRGTLSPTLDAYFRANMERVTGGDKTRPVIVYCQSDCWMSWNAVKRAAGYGHRHLYWYPEGTDGWREWDDRPLADAVPVPVAASPK